MNAFEGQARGQIGAGGQEERVPGDDLFGVLWRRRRLALAATLVVLVGATAAVLLRPATYTSTSRLFVERRGPKLISQEEGVLAGSRNYLYTQAELLTSVPIVKAALAKGEVGKLDMLEGQEDAAGYLREAVEVSVGRRDDILRVSMRGKEPVEAAVVVNAVVDAYVDYHEGMRRTTNTELLRILQKEKTEREAELREKYEELAAYAREQGVLSFEDEGGNVETQRLRTLAQALTQAQLERAEWSAMYEAVNGLRDDPGRVKQLAAQHDRGDIYEVYVQEETRLREHLNELEARKRGLRSEATGRHPSVRSLDVKIAQVRWQLQHHDHRFAEAYRRSLIQQLQASVKKEEEILAVLEEQRARAQDLNAKGAQHAYLEAEVRRTEKLCETLDERIKELDVNEEAGALNITVLERAAAETSVRQRQTGRMLITVVLAALGVGIFTAMLSEWVDYRFRSTAEVQQQLGAAVLGMVPRMARGGGLRRHGREVLVDATSGAAEAFRAIRTGLYYAAGRDKGQVLLVSSARAGEGKSTLVSNLGLAMAQAGEKVLIVDGDFRHASQGVIFGSDERRGLAEVLSGAVEAEEAVYETEVAGLKVLGRGGRVARPSEVLSREDWPKLLEELRGRYDWVLVDSPPVLAVPDARMMAGEVDWTVLVIRSETSKRVEGREAREALLSVGARLIGVVINDVKRREGRYGYGCYGKGYYGTAKQGQEPRGQGSAREVPAGRDDQDDVTG